MRRHELQHLAFAKQKTCVRSSDASNGSCHRAEECALIPGQMKRVLFGGLIVMSAAFHEFAQAALTPQQLKLLPAPANRPVTFDQDVMPILEASCVKCHGRGRSKGDFRIDTRET